MNEREWGWVQSQSTRSRSIMTTLGVLITLFVTLFLAVNNLPETSTLLIVNEKTLQITDINYLIFAYVLFYAAFLLVNLAVTISYESAISHEFLANSSEEIEIRVFSLQQFVSQETEIAITFSIALAVGFLSVMIIDGYVLSFWVFLIFEFLALLINYVMMKRKHH
ncbi:hypothetical protein SDC9_25413 [bioreactor metagenome]|uniref:Uncharacterized protein n=1 Tax=bioreactor metagenome TaxID=1076179 RepID=A0A644UKS0_9ZZZZ|nr:hypothetical protein [Methanocorpusculum sp.]